MTVLAVALAGCAERTVIQQVNFDVNQSHPYQHYAKRDFRELKEGEGGNCAALAYTKKIRLERAGIRSTIMACKLQTGEGHAFLLTDEGVMDNRFNEVVHYANVGCE